MIMGVGVAIVLVLLVLVGLPLLAWWVATRPVLDRLGAGAEEDPRALVIQAHALTLAEADEVERAVTWGRALTEPRLRAAAVDWATRLEGAARRRRERRGQLDAWLIVLAVVAGAGAVGYAVFAVVADRGDGLPWVTVVQWLLFSAIGWRRRQGPARAIVLNSGPPPSR
jgi:hypothetical protein